MMRILRMARKRNQIPLGLFVSFVVVTCLREKPMAEILFKEESFKIIGACFEVHNEKGSGFVEPVYQE